VVVTTVVTSICWLIFFSWAMLDGWGEDGGE
jgi:hypothetical protein